MRKNELKIYLASPRGFCAGVDRAIEIVKKSIDKFGPPVYVRHEIVHNKHVVESLKKIGAIFVEEISEIKDKSRPVIFSAHGVPKKVPREAEKLNMNYIDATCPLVSKVHREAENMHKKGYHFDWSDPKISKIKSIDIIIRDCLDPRQMVQYLSSKN